MEDKLVDLKITKIIQEYTFLKSDEDYKKELININQVEFLKIINEEISKIDSSKIKPQDNEPKGEKPKPEPKLKDEFISHNDKVKMKKIYREIVKLTHPDRVEDKDKHDLYLLATNAYDQFDLFELYFIAKSLKINFKLTMDETKILNELIEVKKEEITQLEKSFVWLWINSSDDSKKMEVVNSFIKTHYLV
jgi:hypothetical protein